MFCVSVPVLSEQIFVAPPMISQEDNSFTRLFSSFILFTENAKAIVTASGRPSGTATTIIVIAIKKLFTTAYKLSKHKKQASPITMSTTKWISNATIVNAAATVPIFPISSATVSSFYCKGVGGRSS